MRRDPVLHHRVQQCGGGDDVRGQLGRQVGLVGPAGHVHDRVEALVVEDGQHGRRVAAVGRVPVAGESLGLGHQVEADDLVAEIAQPEREDAAERAGRAGEEDAHERQP